MSQSFSSLINWTSCGSLGIKEREEERRDRPTLMVSRSTRSWLQPKPWQKQPWSLYQSSLESGLRGESSCPSLAAKRSLGRKCQRPRASACFRALSRKSAILEFLLLLFAAAATTAAAEAESAKEAMGSPKGGGGNIR